jgi:hypothetical protein
MDEYSLDEDAEERRRLEEARRKQGVVGFGPKAPTAPVAPVAPSIGFTKNYTPEEKQKQAAALQLFLRNRR